MKRTVVLSLFVVASLILGSSAMAAQLTAGGGDGVGIDVGDVTVSIDSIDYVGGGLADVTLKVEFSTNDSWLMMAAHAAAGKAVADIPQNKNANPKVGKFEAEWEAANTTEATATFALYVTVKGLPVGSPTDVIVAAHAEVVTLTDDGEDEDEYPDIVKDESAWGDGDQFNEGKNWAMYLTEEVTVPNN